MILEIISNSVESAIAAEKGGADRIELCENLIEGGVTPSMGCVELTRAHIKLDIFVMIRPRGGDFLYSDHEFEVMKKNIQLLKEKGVQGVVFGLLREDGTIDVKRTKELVEVARPLEVTFHRAFDAVDDPNQALEDVISTGADRILTSGLAANAPEGSEAISELIRQAAGRIKIMPGGGVNHLNISELIEKTGATEFHFSAKKLIESKMRFRRNTLNIGYRVDSSEYERIMVDENQVRKVKELMLEFQV